MKNRMNMKRLTALSLGALLLSGCALPVPLTVASLVADGVSYGTTSKSLSDHGLSLLTNRDCAMHRLLETGYVCGDPLSDDSDVTLAAKDRFDTMAEPAFMREAEASPDLAANTEAAAGVYMVVASSRNLGIADDVAERLQPMAPRIFAHPIIGNEIMYRVVAGPVTRNEYPAATSYAAQFGVDKPWALMIGEDDWRYGQHLLNTARAVNPETAQNPY